MYDIIHVAQIIKSLQTRMHEAHSAAETCHTSGNLLQKGEVCWYVVLCITLHLSLPNRRALSGLCVHQKNVTQ